MRLKELPDSREKLLDLRDKVETFLHRWDTLLVHYHRIEEQVPGFLESAQDFIGKRNTRRALDEHARRVEAQYPSAAPSVSFYLLNAPENFSLDPSPLNSYANWPFAWKRAEGLQGLMNAYAEWAAQVPARLAHEWLPMKLQGMDKVIPVLQKLRSDILAKLDAPVKPAAAEPTHGKSLHPFVRASVAGLCIFVHDRPHPVSEPQAAFVAALCEAYPGAISGPKIRGRYPVAGNCTDRLNELKARRIPGLKFGNSRLGYWLESPD